MRSRSVSLKRFTRQPSRNAKQRQPRWPSPPMLGCHRPWNAHQSYSAQEILRGTGGISPTRFSATHSCVLIGTLRWPRHRTPSWNNDPHDINATLMTPEHHPSTFFSLNKFLQGLQSSHADELSRRCRCRLFVGLDLTVCVCKCVASVDFVLFRQNFHTPTTGKGVCFSFPPSFTLDNTFGPVIEQRSQLQKHLYLFPTVQLPRRIVNQSIG